MMMIIKTISIELRGFGVLGFWGFGGFGVVGFWGFGVSSQSISDVVCITCVSPCSDFLRTYS